MLTEWTLQGRLRTRAVKKHARVFARACLVAAATSAIAGCAASPDVWSKTVGNNTAEIDQISASVDAPNPEIYTTSYTSAPITSDMLVNAEFTNYADLSLDDVSRLAMQNSTVLRDIGGVVLRTPDLAKTRYIPSLAETDPRFSMEAALSAFDAQFTASAMYNDNDRLFNNAFFAGGTSSFAQDLHEYNIGIDKRTATGALLSVRSKTIYDNNNAPANTFFNYYETLIEAEVRQPLLQGAGLEFNRIAGPGAQPGLYNGVLIAKTNSDITNHDFRIALRDYLSNVENAYWDLYFAYRELDARKKAMEQSLEIWNAKQAESGVGLEKTPDESLARQQYYKFKADVDEAISGRLLQGTQTRNGSTGGTLQATGGVLVAERRLRLLIGMPAADGALLRPSEEPVTAKVLYDWSTISQEALSQRSELRRQQLVTKKKEMELLAAKNFLNPRLDAVARYRARGLGDDFLTSGGNSGDTPNSGLGNALTGEHQEYMIGFELAIPLGYRQGHAAVSNAEFALSHARAIFEEQQREVVNNLAGSIADAARAYQAIENNLNQYLAAKDYLDALEARARNLNDPVDLILDAQTRLVESEVRLFRARAEYAIALKNIQFEKGSLLNYANMHLVDTTTSAEKIVEPSFIEPAPEASEIEAADTPEVVQVSEREIPQADFYFEEVEDARTREEIEEHLAQIEETMQTGLDDESETTLDDGQVSQAQAEEFGLFELEDSIGSDEELAEEIRTISQETKEAVEPQQISQPQPKKSVFRNMKFWK
ncbi:MAG: TolC family protein [Planctomicrobium sp.]|nr:TolC family protein [Planctomicrobium sp.]